MLKNKKLFWLIGILIAVIGAEVVLMDNHRAFDRHDEATPPSPSFRQQKSLNAHLQGKLSSSSAFSGKSRTPTSIISEEAYAISQLDEHPEQTEQKLKNLALSLESKELHELKIKVLNQDLNGDDRMLAAYLLSLSQDSNATSLLEEIALAALPQSATPSVEFEYILRAQAIEGLQNREDKQQAVKSLSLLTKKLTDKNLQDRSQRALSHHLYGTPELSVQDKKALEAFVK